MPAGSCEPEAGGGLKNKTPAVFAGGGFLNRLLLPTSTAHPRRHANADAYDDDYINDDDSYRQQRGIELAEVVTSGHGGWVVVKLEQKRSGDYAQAGKIMQAPCWGYPQFLWISLCVSCVRSEKNLMGTSA
jgi:hypothetical protein